jgi:hypothetical protein
MALRATGEAGCVLDTGAETEKDAAIGSTALTARRLKGWCSHPVRLPPKARLIRSVGAGITDLFV